MPNSTSATRRALPHSMRMPPVESERPRLSRGRLQSKSRTPSANALSQRRARPRTSSRTSAVEVAEAAPNRSRARLSRAHGRPQPRTQTPSVEAALGLVEPFADECLDRVAGTPDDRVGVVLRRERRQHVVGDRTRVARDRAARHRRGGGGTPATRAAARSNAARCVPPGRPRASPGGARPRGRPRRARRAPGQAAACRTRPQPGSTLLTRSCRSRA